MNKTVSFSKNSINVFFHILTKCNLKCRHCYINPEQHGNNLLSASTIGTWLSSFSDKSKNTNVIFLGGEPTLHPDLPNAIKKATALGYQSITVDTNGYLFNDFLLKINPDEVDFISFSLDGAKEMTNDKIRGTGSYKKCIAGIKAAVSRGFNTSLIYTVSMANIQELHKMPGLLKELGINRFFIQVIGIRGKFVQTGDAADIRNVLQVSKKEWLNRVPDVAQKVAESGITVTYPKVFLSPEEPFECAGLVADYYFKFPNGRVYRCPLCEDFPVHSMAFRDDRLVTTKPMNENDLFRLNIPEGCVMNKLIQPENLKYDTHGKPEYKIACCLLKEEIISKEG